MIKHPFSAPLSPSTPAEIRVNRFRQSPVVGALFVAVAAQFIAKKSIALVLLMGAISLVGCQGSETGDGSKLTFYGRIVLGNDPTDPQMIHHFIVRGNQIFLDQNKNGQPEDAELVEGRTLPAMVDSKGETTYQIKELQLTRGMSLVSESSPQQLSLAVTRQGQVNYDQTSQLFLSLNPEQSNWVQFHGAGHFLMDLFESEFVPGQEVQIRVSLGTTGLGANDSLGQPQTGAITPEQASEFRHRFACVVPTAEGPVPDVEIEVPISTDTDNQPDSPPYYRVKVPLSDIC